MKKEEFYFDSRDGKSRIHAVRYLPGQQPAVCVVQLVHGMAEYVERYEEFAGFLTDRGCIVTGNDHLGHGKSVQEGQPKGYFCEQDPATVAVRDVHRLKKMTQQLYPGIPYIILGHSMGSFILRNYLCRYGSGITAAVIMGTGMQPPALVRASKALAALQKLFLGSKHKAVLIDKLAFGGYNKRIPDARTAFDWLSRDAEQVAKYNADPLCGFIFTVNGFQTLFELIARVQKRENLEKMPKGLPLLVISGNEDPVGEYGEGVRRAYASLKEVGMENVTLSLTEGGRHELLNETDREAVMQKLWTWMKEQI